MAVLEKLRNKGGTIIVIAIFTALMAFVLSDLLGPGSSIFGSSKMELANINGTTVSIMEFQEKVTKMEEFNKLNRQGSLSEDEIVSIRDQTWNQLLNQILLGEIFDKLGIVVTSDELMDMITGKNIHTFMTQLFTNPETGTYDPEQAINFLKYKNQDPTASFYWSVLEEMMINERLQNKFTNLVKKGMYVTQAQIDDEIISRGKSVDFDFVMVRYTSIADSTIIIEDTEINSYYQENKDQFKQEASRDFEYIAFDIIPSESDREMVYETTLKMKNEFSRPETHAIQYVQLNSDEPHIDGNFRLDGLSAQIQDFIVTAEIDDVYGPYFENDAYKLSRLIDIIMVPDSVKARHILIQEDTLEEANRVADSLLVLARKKVDFAILVLANSKDQGSIFNGGDLGWFTEGQMVKPFNDACFQGKKGDIVKVESQFGIHIIEILEQTKPIKKYQVATLERKLIYSSKTYQDTYLKANSFKANNNNATKFDEAVTEQNLTKRFGRQVRENERRVGTLESPRELVKWAFGAKVGEVSPVFEFGNQFVIALLTVVAEEGFSSVETVKQRIERELMNKKKAEILIEQFNTAKSEINELPVIAEKMNVAVQNAANITFSSYSVPGAGSEPALISLAVNSPVDEISKPVKGNNGVFIVKVTAENPSEVQTETVKNQLVSNATSGIDYQMIETIKKNAKVKDNRAKFY